MRGSTPWTLATLVLAVTSVVLIVRELSRPPPVVPPPPGPGARFGPTETPPHASGQDSTEDGVRLPRIEIGGAANAPAGERSPPTDEQVRDYLLFWVVGTTPGADRSRWRRALPQLRRWKAQVVPMLEGWLRRAEELHAQGVSLVAAVGAYATLAGPDALPLLRELHRGTYRYAVPAALIRIDSEEAAEFLAELIRADRPGKVSVRPVDMMAGTAPIKALVRLFAEGHSDPGARLKFRHALFRYGNAEEREWVWNSSPGGEDFRSLYSSIPSRWDERWQERYRASVLEQVGSPVEYLRYAALLELARFPHRFGPEWGERARAAVEAEISERPGDAVRKKRLEKLLAALSSAQRNEARAREVRDLLGD